VAVKNCLEDGILTDICMSQISSDEPCKSACNLFSGSDEFFAANVMVKETYHVAQVHPVD
jgi:hypothetical protein